MKRQSNIIETVPGPGHWHICFRIMENAGVEILRAVTCDRNARLPGEIRGLPVTGLAEHALSGDSRDPDAAPGLEEVEVTDGRLLAGEAEWSNRGIETLELPESLEEVGDYAFLNCRGMTDLSMEDREIRWGRSVFMNCRKLCHVMLHRRHMEEDRGMIAFFAGETTGEITVTIRAEVGKEEEGDGEREARLVFPDYVELYTENNEARQFDYTIEGAGYPYRHVFRDRRLDWRDYDALWKSYLGRETDPERAARMAWYRVSRPVELSEEYRGPYEVYVKAHFGLLADLLIGRGEAEELSRLIRLCAPEDEALALAADTARQQGRTDCLAVLMDREYRSGRGALPRGRAKRYEL